MRAPLLSALGLAALCGLPARAQDSCQNPVTNAEMTECSHDSWQAEDARLNDAYQAVLSLMTQWDADLPAAERGGVQALKEGQRAWITFRDKSCEAEGYAVKGGSAEPLIIYGCMRQLTQDRANQLWSTVEAYGAN